MTNIYTHVAGNTLDSHEKFLHKLCKRGAKVVKPPKEAKVAIVFCPIVSRFQCDVDSALSSASEYQDVILVAMHHTFDEDYRLPSHRELNNPTVRLVVDCLFHETKGFFRCPCNKKAVKMVCEELNLGSKRFSFRKTT